MIRALVVLSIIWLALMPPLFTAGACTAEYEAASAIVDTHRPALKTPAAALQFFRSQAIEASLLTPEDCARAKPRYLRQCASGALVVAEVPVRNRICSLYRDERTRIQLQYDRRERLGQVLSEMNPYKYLPLPWGGSVDWAR